MFNLELDSARNAAGDRAGRLAPAANPFRDPRVREAIDLAIDGRRWPKWPWRASARRRRRWSRPASSGTTRRFRSRRRTSRARALLTEAGFPNGFRVNFSFTTTACPATGRRHRDGADAGAHRARGAGGRPAGRGDVPRPRPRRAVEHHGRLGHADRRGELHSVLRGHSTTRSAASAPSTGAATRTRRWTG